LLLQRNAEEHRSADAAAHDPKEIVDADSLLDVVRQVEVRVVVLVGRIVTVWSDRFDTCGDKQHQAKQRQAETHNRQQRAKTASRREHGRQGRHIECHLPKRSRT
jgi:hypothetical protein